MHRGYILATPPATLRTVAALYIDPRSVYPTLPGVECWDEARDARLYAGPHPVVAHPACGPWSRLRHMYRGSEGGIDCALAALDAVRFFGGVLEHPADSQLWFCDPVLAEHLGRFGAHTDRFGGVSHWCEQVDWGHVATKRTWLYCVRCTPEAPPYPGRKATHWIGGSRTASSRTGHPIPAGIKACSTAQKRRTPIAFAEMLVRMARSVRA